MCTLPAPARPSTTTTPVIFVRRGRPRGREWRARPTGDACTTVTRLCDLRRAEACTQCSSGARCVLPRAAAQSSSPRGGIPFSGQKSWSWTVAVFSAASIAARVPWSSSVPAPSVRAVRIRGLLPRRGQQPCGRYSSFGMERLVELFQEVREAAFGCVLGDALAQGGDGRHAVHTAEAAASAVLAALRR